MEAWDPLSLPLSTPEVKALRLEDGLMLSQVILLAYMLGRKMLPAVDIIIIIIFTATNIIIITFCEQEFQQNITSDAYVRTPCSYKQHLSLSFSHLSSQTLTKLKQNLVHKPKITSRQRRSLFVAVFSCVTVTRRRQRIVPVNQELVIKNNNDNINNIS